MQSCVGDLADLHVALSGDDALRLVRQRLPDLVMLDLHLGDTDGLSLLQHWRSDPALAGVPVIFLSAELDAQPHVHALEADALDWLAKPVDPLRLRARVQAALRRAARWPQAPRGADRGLAAGPLVGARVLAVDDDPILLESLRLALAPEGFDLRTATSAAEALALAAEHAPEVMLIDLVMPDEDGFKLARRLMALPTLADVPLIFVTQHGDVAAEARALGMGAFDFIAKPIVAPVLRARVCNALRLVRRSAEAVHRMEAKWRHVSEHQMAAIVALARDPIICVDKDRRLRMANEAAQALLGATDPLGMDAALPAWLQVAQIGRAHV